MEPSIKPNDIVHIEFWDHCEAGDPDDLGIVICNVFGQVFKLDQLQIIVRCWQSQSHKDDHFYCIIKSAITKMVLLRPVS